MLVFLLLAPFSCCWHHAALLLPLLGCRSRLPQQQPALCIGPRFPSAQCAGHNPWCCPIPPLIYLQGIPMVAICLAITWLASIFPGHH